MLYLTAIINSVKKQLQGRSFSMIKDTTCSVCGFHRECMLSFGEWICFECLWNKEDQDGETDM